MPRIGFLVSALLPIFCASLGGQEITVRTGTQIPVELRTKIDTHSVKPGAKIEFHTTEAVLIGHNIVVPERATVIGRVEQVSEGQGKSSNSVLRISINRLKWKHAEAPLNAVIISIEQTPAQQILQSRGRRFRDPPTFLKNVHIRAHLSRNASTEFYSKRPRFVVSKGLYFLLRQVDPDHDPNMAGTDHVLDVGPQN
jgi:hypothetical protein